MSSATGPKTTEGKRRSSLNAMRHGLYAKSKQGLEMVAEATGKAYEAVLDEMRACYRPVDVVEDMLVRRIARCTWRMLYTEAMENRAIQKDGLSLGCTDNRERLIRYERFTDIQLHRAIEALSKKRCAEKETPRNELPRALFPSVTHAQAGEDFVPSKTQDGAGSCEG